MTTPNEIKPAAPAEGLDGGRCAVDAGFGVWRPIQTAPTKRESAISPTPRFLLLCASGKVEIGWHDADAYAKRPRPYWYLEGRFSRVLDMRGDQPTHWMPLPPNVEVSHAPGTPTRRSP